MVFRDILFFFLCGIAACEAIRGPLSSFRGLGPKTKLAKSRRKQLESQLDASILTQANPEPRLNFFEIMLCGALSTVLGDVTLHPIDTIKIVQQAAAVPLSLGQAVRKITANGGLMGFYDGVVPYAIGDGLSGISLLFHSRSMVAGWNRYSDASESFAR